MAEGSVPYTCSVERLNAFEKENTATTDGLDP